MLIEARADVSETDPDEKGHTPLQIAAREGKTELVAMLMEAEVTFNTLLHWAVQSHYRPDTIRILIEHRQAARNQPNILIHDKGNPTSRKPPLFLMQVLSDIAFFTLTTSVSRNCAVIEKLGNRRI